MDWVEATAGVQSDKRVSDGEAGIMTEENLFLCRNHQTAFARKRGLG